MIRLDQVDKLLAFLGETEEAEPGWILYLDRLLGKHHWKQVGDGYDSDAVDSYGDHPAFLEALQTDKAKGLGRWRLRRYVGLDAEGKPKTQPECRFETGTDSPRTKETDGKAQEGAAVRDLAQQLQANSASTMARFEQMAERLDRSAKDVLEVVQSAHMREVNVREGNGQVITNQAIDLVKAHAKIQFLEFQLQNAKTGRGFWEIVGEKVPESAWTPVMQGAGMALAHLGTAAADWIKARALPAPAGAVARIEAKQDPKPEQKDEEKPAK